MCRLMTGIKNNIFMNKDNLKMFFFLLELFSPILTLVPEDQCAVYSPRYRLKSYPNNPLNKFFQIWPRGHF